MDERAVPTIAGRWTVVSVRDANGLTPYETTETTWPHPVTVGFRPERLVRRLPGLRWVHGSFDGITGCNSTSGTYRQSGYRLRPRGAVATTLVGSVDEPDVHEVLRRMRRIATAPDGCLRLLDGDRQVLAELRRSG